jgi:hypothetical protein
MATFIETAIQDLAKLCQEYKTLQKDPEIKKCIDCEIHCDDLEKNKKTILPLTVKQQEIFAQAMKMCIGENWNKDNNKKLCESCGKEPGPAGLNKNLGQLVCEYCEI